MKKNFAVVFTCVLMAACLVLCGCGAKGINADYFAIYDKDTDAAVMAAMPADTFMPVDVTDSITNGGMRLEVSLLLESTGDYTFVFEYYDPAVTDENAANYFKYHVGFIGTYTMDGDTVTMKPAEIADITYTAGSDYTADAANAVFSYDGSGQSGSWYSDDDASLLTLFQGGTATVSDGTLVSWSVNK